MPHISGQVSSGSLALLVSAEVWEVLFKFDEFLAEETRLKGCARCGGTNLYAVNYTRADWGLPSALRGLHPRLSLSCDDCGKRAQPPSVRYAGRRLFDLLARTSSTAPVSFARASSFQKSPSRSQTVTTRVSGQPAESSFARSSPWTRRMLSFSPLWQKLASVQIRPSGRPAPLIATEQCARMPAKPDD